MQHSELASVHGADSLQSGISAPLNGRYRVIREIGGGGMSTTMLARDIEEARDVVLKIAPVAANPKTAHAQHARFEREAAALRGLKHANIVEILDSFVMPDGRFALVLEYVAGSTLQQRIDADGPVPLAEFVPIASQMLKALQHIHSRGSVLRDIKPSNVMLCEKDRYVDIVKVIDFGLTRLSTGGDRVTQDGTVGTPGFIAPEEIRGQTVDFRADLYSLAALFYYALCGRPPFVGHGAAVLYKQAHEQPDPLRDALPSNSKVSGELIDDCLNPDPQGRPESTVAVVERMIDAVPARLFRPRKRVERHRGNLSTSSYSVVTTLPAAPAPTGTQTIIVQEKRVGGLWLPLVAVGVAAGTLLLVVFRWPQPSTSETERPAAARTTPEQRLSIAAQAADATRSERKPAMLSVRSTPVADVWLDGEAVGNTPLQLDVGAGEHDLRVRTEGYSEWSKTLVVAAGARESLDLQLRADAAPAKAAPRRPRRRAVTRTAQAEVAAAPPPSAPQPAQDAPKHASAPNTEVPPAPRFEKLGGDRRLKRMGGRGLK